MATILICEPSLTVGELLAEIVERAGHNPLRFNGGEPPECDLVLFEPGMDGVLDCLRAARLRRADVPAIAVSMYPRERELDEFEPLVFMAKPFSVAEIQAAIAEALRAGAEE